MTVLEWQDSFSDDEAWRKYLFKVWAIYGIAMDKGGHSALALSRELGLPYVTAWLLHHKIRQAMAERNSRYPLGGVLELGNAYFGGVSPGPRKQDRGTDQDPVLVGVSLTDYRHPQCGLFEAVPDLKDPTVKAVLARWVAKDGVWRTDGAPVDGGAVQEHHADHQVTLSTDPQAEVVFHWRAMQRVLGVNIVISNAKAYIDWRIEARLHDVRDMAFDEDRNQIRTASGPEVMATLCYIAIGLIQRTLEHLGRRPE